MGRKTQEIKKKKIEIEVIKRVKDKWENGERARV